MHKKIRKNESCGGLKWFGSILLLIGLCFTSYNIFPLNLYFMIIGTGTWVLVSYFWKDYALMLLNSVSFIISVSGLINYWT
jgi:hypothetical protein